VNATRTPIAQIPAHRVRDHLTGKPYPAGADTTDLELITAAVSAGELHKPTQQVRLSRPLVALRAERLLERDTDEADSRVKERTVRRLLLA
jgi:hypothetical protein